jgi:anti-sigma factor RsiW
MSCAIWEERVALLAGGDLDAAAAAGVERHLNQCAPCRALAVELRAGLDCLRAAHAEPIEAERYAAVRGRVLAELAKPPRRRAMWPWAVPLVAAAAAVLAVMMKPAASPAPEMLHAVAIAPGVERERGLDRSRTVAAPKRTEARPAETPFTVRTEPARTHASAGRGAAPPEVADAPVRMVQLATADPNVVIYWLFEERGEER